jgi:copper chaperone CopZ
MMFQLEESKASKQVGVELELKKIEVDNLRLSLQESQQKLSVQTSKMQEQDQAFALFQKNSKREANEIKTQLQNYKNKYEAELARRN